MAGDPPWTVTLTEAEDDPAFAPAVQVIDAYNVAQAGPHGYQSVNLVVRRAGEDAPCGGLFGFALYGWFFVRLLVLPPDLRRVGLGSVLIRRIEAEARARGCIGLWLDTFDFQARPFYLKHGFVEFGTLPDHPPGHARHFLMKRLDGQGDGQALGESHVPT